MTAACLPYCSLRLFALSRPQIVFTTTICIKVRSRSLLLLQSPQILQEFSENFSIRIPIFAPAFRFVRSEWGFGPATAAALRFGPALYSWRIMTASTLTSLGHFSFFWQQISHLQHNSVYKYIRSATIEESLVQFNHRKWCRNYLRSYMITNTCRYDLCSIFKNRYKMLK